MLFQLLLTTVLMTQKGRSSTNINLFASEMKYLHENGFKVIPMSDLGYDQITNYMYIRNNQLSHIVFPCFHPDIGTIRYIVPSNVRTYRNPSGPTSRSVIVPNPCPNITDLRSSGLFATLP